MFRMSSIHYTWATKTASPKLRLFFGDSLWLRKFLMILFFFPFVSLFVIFFWVLIWLERNKREDLDPFHTNTPEKKEDRWEREELKRSSGYLTSNFVYLGNYCLKDIWITYLCPGMDFLISLKENENPFQISGINGTFSFIPL